MTARTVLQDASFAQAAARRMLALGLSPAEVFEGTGFGQVLLDQLEPAAPTARIAGFFDHAEKLTGDGLFGFHLAQSCGLKQAGLLGYITLSAPTAGSFLQDLARYAPVLSDSWQLDAATLEADGVLGWSCTAGAAARARQYAEFLAALFLTALRQSSGGRVRPVKLEFLHQRREGLDEMEAVFGCPVAFGAAAGRALFRPDDLALPLEEGEPRLLRLLRSYGDLLLSGQVRRARPLCPRSRKRFLPAFPRGLCHWR